MFTRTLNPIGAAAVLQRMSKRFSLDMQSLQRGGSTKYNLWELNTKFVPHFRLFKKYILIQK